MVWYSGVSDKLFSINIFLYSSSLSSKHNQNIKIQCKISTQYNIEVQHNTITNINTDQRGYNGEHTITFATAKLREWETSNKFMDPLRYKEKSKVIITYVPDSEKNRKKPRKGRV